MGTQMTYSDDVTQRRTDNSMTKRNQDKRTNTNNDI